MSDERLLSEALRAHAAGGVSTPRTDGPPTAGAPAPDAGNASTSGRRRFRPLGRVRRPEQPAPSEQGRNDKPRTDQPRTDQPRPDQARPDQVRVEPSAPERTARPDVPAPRSGGPGLPPPGYGRGPMPPAPPTAPVRPGPVSGGFGTTTGPRTYAPPARGGAPFPSAAPTAATAGYVPWSVVTVTWWSLVAVLAGGVVGGAIGVLSLLLPA